MKKGPSKAKAAEILHDGTANGHPLTDKQRRFMAWVAYGKKNFGGQMNHGGNVAMAPYHNLPKDEYDRIYNELYGSGGDNIMYAKGGKNFSSAAAYKKWLAYGHSTGVFERTPGNQKVSIKGKAKKVKHKKDGGPCYECGGPYEAKSGIYIKPQNRGKFTDYCGGKVTQECIERAKRSSSPTLRKRAVFAENARKWSHQTGGKVIIQENANLPFLNAANFVLGKIAESKRNKEFEDYNRQMIMLQNQPATYTPEGEFQYGSPMYQMGGVIPQDLTYMISPFDTPSFPEALSVPEPKEVPVPQINKQGRVEQGAFKGVEQDVADAADELLNMFPKLRITSTVRTWGDKDAHPKGKAVDVSGDAKTLAEAWKYYKDFVVQKYGFNPALPVNHGTGPHIHVGFY